MKSSLDTKAPRPATTVRRDKEWDEDRTLLARAGVDNDPTHGAITPALYTSSNFSFQSLDNPRPYDYSRSGNPTRDELGRLVAELERGDHAIVTSTGMSAIALVLKALQTDDLILAPHDCYGGTYRLLQSEAADGRFRVKFADLTDASKLDDAFAEKPTMVLIETPSNPLLRITDIKAVAARAKTAGALVVADNTFLSPLLQKPLKHGADIVVHSTTKYINGHSDIVGGAVVVKDRKTFDRLVAWRANANEMTGAAWWANNTGVTASPHDSWMTLRGARTLALRIAEQTKSAGAIAQSLRQHRAVSKVYYPGLADHPGHATAARQQKGFGAMLSFELKNPSEVAPFIHALTKNERPLFSLAESLGGFESLIAHPVTMTHKSMGAAGREAAGITDGLLRISVGLEAQQHLIKALQD
nr:aminotransferase class I/II-fold pyridoxal phosphate-dependent enzyme [Pseudomonadota bacterium]